MLCYCTESDFELVTLIYMLNNSMQEQFSK